MLQGGFGECRLARELGVWCVQVGGVGNGESEGAACQIHSSTLAEGAVDMPRLFHLHSCAEKRRVHHRSLSRKISMRTRLGESTRRALVDVRCLNRSNPASPSKRTAAARVPSKRTGDPVQRTPRLVRLSKARASAGHLDSTTEMDSHNPGSCALQGALPHHFL